MRWLAIILIMLCGALSSCHTNKHSTTDTQIAESVESESEQQRNINLVDSSKVLSNWSADSARVVTPTVVNVNGRDSVVPTTTWLYNPKLTKDENRVKQLNDSLNLKLNLKGGYTESVQQEEKSERDSSMFWAVFWGIVGLGFVGAVSMDIFLWRHFKV